MSGLDKEKFCEVFDSLKCGDEINIGLQLCMNSLGDRYDGTPTRWHVGRRSKRGNGITTLTITPEKGVKLPSFSRHCLVRFKDGFVTGAIGNLGVTVTFLEAATNA